MFRLCNDLRGTSTNNPFLSIVVIRGNPNSWFPTIIEILRTNMNQPILFWNYIVKLNHVKSISIYLRVFSMQCFEHSAITVSLVLVQGSKHLNTFPDPKCGPKTKTSMFAFHLDRHESNYPRLCSAHFPAKPSDSVWFGDLVTSFHASPRHLTYLSIFPGEPCGCSQVGALLSQHSASARRNWTRSREMLFCFTSIPDFAGDIPDFASKIQ